MVPSSPSVDPGRVPSAGPWPAGPVVYVDAAALLAVGGQAPRMVPEADAALGYLRESLQPVVLIGDPGPVGAVLRILRDEAPMALAELPPDADGWMITNDAARCAEVRNRRLLRTVLVGPSAAGRGLAHRQSDVEARNLLDAVLTILATDAMPDPDARARTHPGTPRR